MATPSPEQVNLQAASPEAVVVSFVTFEADAPQAPPRATLTGPDSTTVVHHGLTHVHTTHGGRVYYMHFVRLPTPTPRATYRYTVRSGGAAAVDSPTFTFRAPYAADGEPTRIDIFGDLGVYTWNAMEWLHKDCAAGTDADLIVHMGDHAYNEGDGDERRADSYMQAYQQTIANVPWMPIVSLSNIPSDIVRE